MDSLNERRRRPGGRGRKPQSWTKGDGATATGRPRRIGWYVGAALLVGGTALVSVPPVGAATGGNLFQAGAGGKYPTWTANGATAVDVQAGNNTTYFSDASGQAWAFGSNVDGALGSGSLAKTGKDVQVQGVTSVLKGNNTLADWKYAGAAIDSGHHVWVWGDNQFGEFCNGTRQAKNPVPTISTALDGATQVAGGENHLYALLGNGEVVACGNSDLGDGKGQTSSVPVRVQLPAGAVVKEISSGDNNGCALLDPSTVTGTNLYCWGQNGDGQVGDGTTWTPVRTPVPVAGNDTWVAVSVGGGASYGVGSTIAVDKAGQVFTWGDNTSGQLGNSSFTQEDAPTRITLGTKFAGVDLSSDQPVSSGTCTMALLDKSGNVWTWGDGSKDGELGNGSSSYQLTPVVTAAGVALTGQVSEGNHVAAYLSS